MTVCGDCGKELLCLPCSLNIDRAFVLRPDDEILVLQPSPNYVGSIQSLAEELSSAQIPGLTVIILPPEVGVIKGDKP